MNLIARFPYTTCLFAVCLSIGGVAQWLIH